MPSLRERLARARPVAGARIEAPDAALALGDLAGATGLGKAREALAGRSVLVRTARQIAAAQALVELDGLVRRIVLCPPDVDPARLSEVARAAEVDAVVTDAAESAAGTPVAVYALQPPLAPVNAGANAPLETEWLLFTSGTTGSPKLASHSLEGLAGAIAPPDLRQPRPVWATFYDIRRYGGLQVLLRALNVGSALILADADETLRGHLDRLARAGVTHLTGTPSHWRRLLMSDGCGRIDPGYIRLSGEIADQAVLDALAAAFPRARIVHAYASTEAGVCFEVDDGREGFPDSVLRRRGPVEMKVADGSLRIRSPRAARGYLGPQPAALAADDGFIDSGDLVELAGGRWRFVGRRGGVINVGGLKVHPEEVEATLNRHPAVRLSAVRARANPITGAIVTAEVTLVDPAAADAPDAASALRASILAFCRAALPPHKAPASLRFVPELALSAGGKLDRARHE